MQHQLVVGTVGSSTVIGEEGIDVIEHGHILPTRFHQNVELQSLRFPDEDHPEQLGQGAVPGEDPILEDGVGAHVGQLIQTLEFVIDEDGHHVIQLAEEGIVSAGELRERECLCLLGSGRGGCCGL
mmetsp:Transcript_42692/g.43261  ORF Transcript_42692/g.43261 Transcript_42692/m.43261 type:complete len:126 (-) Transcript_42692:199-576(-)